MVLYNITYSVTHEIANDWLRWMERLYLPTIMATGLPAGYKVLRLLTELDNGGDTYSVQLDFNTIADYEAYQAQHADAMNQRVQHRFSNQFVSFDTLLEVITTNA